MNSATVAVPTHTSVSIASANQTPEASRCLKRERSPSSDRDAEAKGEAAVTVDETRSRLAAIAAVDDAPAWAVAMLLQITQENQVLRQEVSNIEKRLSLEVRNLRAVVANGRNRSSNSIIPIVDQNGAVPPNFPPTWMALERLCAAHVDGLLTAFELPLREANGVPMTLAGKKRTLKVFFGFPFQQ